MRIRYKRNHWRIASRVPKEDNGISRRRLLGLAGVIAASFAVRTVYKNADKIAKSQAFGSEEIAVVKKKERMVAGNSGYFDVPTAYVEFRGKVFKLYPVKADPEELGPSTLVHKAHILYNPGVKLESPVLSDAVELFNYFNGRGATTLDGVVEGQKTVLRFKETPTPFVHGDKPYIVPVLLPYKSVDDAVKPRIQA